jgi:hypothetical protein
MSLQMDVRYPIGKDQSLSDNTYNENVKEAHFFDIQNCPGLLESAVLNLDEHQLNSPYREGGWTVKQVVHHVPDSHIHAYTRFKLALTEDNPTIKPYDEVAWANLSDSEIVPINISLTLLHALHFRWVQLMRTMNEDDWQKTVFHPERKITLTLWNLLGSYAWHGKHHVAHITSLRERMGW